MLRALAEDGIQPVGLDVNADLLKGLEAELGNQRFLGLAIDVADAEACRHAVETVLAKFGRIDVLVNCAGLFGEMSPGKPFPRFWERNLENWRAVQAVNSHGAFYMAYYAVPVMLEQRSGRVINVSTSFETMQAPGLAAYGPSKAAMETSAAIWAKELKGTGVTVNVVLPGGPTATAFLPPGYPTEGLLAPAIMGPPTQWLASDAAADMTGRRLIARQWDPALPPAEAAQRCSASAGWVEKE